MPKIESNANFGHWPEAQRRPNELLMVSPEIMYSSPIENIAAWGIYRAASIGYSTIKYKLAARRIMKDATKLDIETDFRFWNELS